MTSALGRVSSEYKNSKGPDKPSVKVYREPANTRYGAGNWQASNRGGVQGGYRSGGASDSEGGRGGRGRGGSYRGGDRGERGDRGSQRGRGGGRGRGFNRSGQGEGAPATTGGES